MILRAVLRNGHLDVDPEELAEYKSLYEDGSIHRMILEPWGDKEGAFRYFHLLRDRYAKAMGYSTEYAKAELKYSYGIYIVHDGSFSPPPWEGKFIELYNNYVFLKSTRVYTKGELINLIMGTQIACIENQIDISDLMGGS